MLVYFGVIRDISSGHGGLLMRCLFWIKAQRMTSRINYLYNTSQQLRLVIVLFPQVHCNQSLSCDGAPPTITWPAFIVSPVRYRSGYRRLPWGSGKAAVCKARGGAALRLSHFFASSREITVYLRVAAWWWRLDEGQRDLVLEGWWGGLRLKLWY